MNKKINKGGVELVSLYLPSEWKLMKYYDSDYVNSIGYSDRFDLHVFLVKLSNPDKYKFVLYDKDENIIYELKESHEDSFNSLEEIKIKK